MTTQSIPKQWRDCFIDIFATVAATIIVFALISAAGWVLVVPHPVVFLVSATLSIVAALPLLRECISLPDSARICSDYSDSYSHMREWNGYEIEVTVTERSNHRSSKQRLERTIVATATDGSETIATSERVEDAGICPATVFDAALESDENGRSEGDQAREVLEEIYDDLIAYEATGTIENTTGIDSAFDVVFGETAEPDGHKDEADVDLEATEDD